MPRSRHEIEAYIALQSLDDKYITCSSCGEKLEDTHVVLDCPQIHRICRRCMKCIQTCGNNNCPACKSPISCDRIQRDETYDVLVQGIVASRQEKLIEALDKLLTLNQYIICASCGEKLEDTNMALGCQHKFCGRCTKCIKKLCGDQCPKCKVSMSTDRHAFISDGRYDALVQVVASTTSLFQLAYDAQNQYRHKIYDKQNRQSNDVIKIKEESCDLSMQSTSVISDEGKVLSTQRTSQNDSRKRKCSEVSQEDNEATKIGKLVDGKRNTNDVDVGDDELRMNEFSSASSFDRPRQKCNRAIETTNGDDNDDEGNKIAEQRSSCKISRRWPNGCRYDGEILDGIPHGRGTYFAPNIGEYIGDWVKGEKSGEGTFKYSNGGRYVGEWLKNKRNGTGRRTWLNGFVFLGEFRNDQMDGKGKLIWPDGSYFEGECKKGQMNGKGKLTWPDGGYYEGEFQYGSMQGKGTRVSMQDKGTRVSMQGKGTRVWANGREFRGEWKDNMRHGRGKLILTDGTLVEGEWEKGKLVSRDIEL